VSETNTAEIGFEKQMGKIIKDGEYTRLIKDIKKRIQNSQIKAALSVNTELILLYWDIAEKIAVAQKNAVWGDGFLQQMSGDLQAEFPDMKGFSYRNLRYIRQWHLFWTSTQSRSKPWIKSLHFDTGIGSSKTPIDRARLFVSNLVPGAYFLSHLFYRRNASR
jgi:hypothetical protein